MTGEEPDAFGKNGKKKIHEAYLFGLFGSGGKSFLEWSSIG
jgi:hypothetical protein